MTFDYCISVLVLRIFLFVSSASALSLQSVPWRLPFHTDSTPQILSSDGHVVKYVGTNWPGHQEVMIPEGLQYQSIKTIVSKIKSFNLNVVRLTFAIEMIDDILDNGGDVSLETALTNVLGQSNGTAILGQILKNNPQLKKTTTRLQVYDAVAKELATQGVYLHLDNHVSMATWCCSNSDGNAWFGDTYFDVSKWLRAWHYMAAHGAANWPSFSSVGLRNELRTVSSGAGEPPDWYTWNTHMTAAAATVHSAAPHVLIFFSGLNYDSDISAIPLGLPLNGTNGTSTAGKVAYFEPRSFAYADKIVIEVHKYDFEKTQASCPDFADSLFGAGYVSIDKSNKAVRYRFPVVLSEWGFAQDGKYWNSTTYNECLIQFMRKNRPSGWMQWDLCGSYMFEKGVQDVDEGWGLLSHDWSTVRSQDTVDHSLTPMIRAIL